MDMTLPTAHVTHGDPVSARPAGFWRDLMSVAGRAVRGVLREPGQLAIGLIVPLFFFVVNVGALSDVSSFTGIDNYVAFQLPVAIVFAVTGISRASALVIDIQSGYFDRLLVSPVNRYSLLLGPRLHRFSLRDSAPYGQPGSGELLFYTLLPVRLPHHHVPPPGGAHRLARHRRRLQPRHLPARRAAGPDLLGLGRRRPPPRNRRRRRRERGDVRARLLGPARPRPPRLKQEAVRPSEDHRVSPNGRIAA
jgi:hypothetical protein